MPIVSAGLLVRSNGRVLLLRRTGNRRGTWGLPGGRLDKGERPREAAFREAAEEIGSLPFGVVEDRLTVPRPGRGKYRVFVLEVAGMARKGWAPELNHEHDKWIWADSAWIRKNKKRLHPAARAAVSS